MEEFFPHTADGDKNEVGEQPGQLVAAADQGSDIYLQKIDMTPPELLVADNGSFLDYMAIENVDSRFNEFIVTNGSRHQYEESITADNWWLFPTKTNDGAVSPTDDPLSTENLTTTRLALDRPYIEIGPGRDFYGQLHYLQTDGTLSTWTYSAWDGAGNEPGDYKSIEKFDVIEGVRYPRPWSESLYITSGPGFGGGPISFDNTIVSSVKPLQPGYVFPREIRLFKEELPENLQTGPGKQFGGRRYYLEVIWSQTPVMPPVMEANYWGASHFVGNAPQNVRSPQLLDPPTVGVAARTVDLRVTVPRAITEGAPDGSPSLGIIPGTVSGTLVFGGVGQEEVYEMTFQERKNIFPEEDRRNDQQNPVLNDRFTFFFDDYDNSGAVSARRTFGLIEAEIETNVIKDIDWRFREEAERTHTYIEGAVVDASVLEFGIGSHVNDDTTNLDMLNQLYGDNNLNDAFRALDGINVIIRQANLLDGTAKNAVRIENLDYHVYVKPAVPNEVYFTAAGDFTRSVTVDLLTEGSSVYVNSPIRVADPDGDIDLRATNVYVNAPMETDDYLILGRSNSEESARLPRLSDPQGGELSTPTFLGSLLSDESTTRTVSPTPVLDGFSVGTLEVLPGREGYGYDPANPPTVTIEPAEILEATVRVAQVAGGVSELLLEDTGEGVVGSGVEGLEFLELTFDDPQLRVVESINRFTQIQDVLTGSTKGVDPPEGYFAAPVIAISPPEILSSAVRIGYGKSAAVNPDNEWGHGLKLDGIETLFQGANYSAVPNIELIRTDGLPVFDPRLGSEYHSQPVLDLTNALVESHTEIRDGRGNLTGYTYGSVSLRPGIRLSLTGFGLNIRGSTRQQVIDDLQANFAFRVTGGYNPNYTYDGFPVTPPPPSDIEQAVIVPVVPLLGTLAWKGNSLNDNVAAASDDLLERGLHYELAPDVQFVGKLTAEVPLEFRVDEDFDGDDGVDGNDVYGDPVVIDGGVSRVDVTQGQQFYRASLENVFAFADGTDNYPLAKGQFRDVDYLEYLNDRQKLNPETGELIRANEVVTVHASVDGQTWFRVVPVESDTLTNFYWPARGEAGTKEITLRDGFTNWQNIEEGMTITLPSMQEVTIVQWFENTRTIAVAETIEVGFTEVEEVAADQVAGLGPEEQPRGIRFGGPRTIIDPYRQQLSFRKVNYDTDKYYWPANASNSAYTRTFDRDIDKNQLRLETDDTELEKIDVLDVRYFRIFMDPWFEEVSIDSNGERTAEDTEDISGRVDAEMKAFASMGFDNARGRAALSGPPGQRQITYLEVTHPGSGYTEIPDVSIDGTGGGASARAIVSGGVYELEVIEPGFNYSGDVLPGLAAEVWRNVTIPVFDIEDLPAGAELPKADFLVRNTAIRGGFMSDPGKGLKIIGAAGSRELAGFEKEAIPLAADEGLELDNAVFQAIVEPDGRILRFEKLRGGTGYRIAPKAQVESPLPPRSATAVASINSSLGLVSSIDVVDEGHRYAIAPKVYVLPPTPRGEGRVAKAVAVLGPSGEVMRIEVTDPGLGYTAPPLVVIQEVDAYNVVEYVDIAAQVSAHKYELYVSRNTWTDRERGLVLLRPTNPLGYSAGTGTSEWIYIEAAATDLVFEADVDATDVTVLMNSREVDQPFAPYELTTLSTATGTQSGTILADQLVVTMGNDVPTPLSGGSLVNSVNLRTDVRTLRATAAVSERNPRGAFPYDIRIEAIDDLTIEAVPRSSGKIDLVVPGDLAVRAGILTDGDINIETTTFNQTTPLITEFGAIAITANEITLANSVIVRAAPLDERNSDISLQAINGSLSLEGTVRSPNSVYLRQVGAAGTTGGNTRITTQELRIEAEGTVDVFTDVDVARGSSDFGDFTLDELNDISIPTLQVPNGVIRLTANGVDLGGEAINPIALTARIVEGQDLYVSTPNGSMDIDVDTSSDLSLGVLDKLSTGTEQPMLASGSVRIVNASGSVNIYDGPVAGQNALVVKAASTGRLPDVHAYAGNTPGEFPSELSGPGRFPTEAFAGLETPLRVGDLILLKDQFDRPESSLFDESRENGVYEILRLGGGDSGYQDWKIRRAVQADARPDLLPGSYVRVREGALQGEIYQIQYSVLPTMGVTRTLNNQLVIGAGVGGLLGVDLNDVVTGDGITPGARVTGVDYENGVVTLGVGNGYQVANVNPSERTVFVVARQSLLFESLRVAKAKGERALISGHWFNVGASVDSWDENTGKLTISEGGIREDASASESPEGAVAVIGFSSAATDRVSLNPAVRTFLLSSIEDEVTHQVNLVRTLEGEDADADQELDYTRVVLPGGGRSRNTIDVLATALAGWAVKVGDELTYTIKNRNGQEVDHINRVVTVTDGNATSQDDVPNGIIRLGLGESTLSPTWKGEDIQGQDLGYELPTISIRNRSRVVPESPASVDWDALYVGMQVEAPGLSDRTTTIFGDPERQLDGTYRYSVNPDFLVYGRLEEGMAVSGENVPSETVLLSFDPENGTVNLNNRLLSRGQLVKLGGLNATLSEWAVQLDNGGYRYRVDPSFVFYADLEVGDDVQGDTVSGPTKIIGFDDETRSVDLDRRLNDPQHTVTFGEKYTTLVDWSRNENFLGFSDEIETTDFRVDVEFTVESFTIENEVVIQTAGTGYPRDTDVKIAVYFSEPETSRDDGGVQMQGYAVPDGDGGIKRVIITEQGAGYDQAPAVYIASPGGGGATATASVIYNRGTGYANYELDSDDQGDPLYSDNDGKPLRKFNDANYYALFDQAQLLSSGVGYTTNRDVQIAVTFAPPDESLAAGARQMAGYAVPNGTGGIERIVVTTPGLGYDEIPEFEVAPPADPNGVAAEGNFGVESPIRDRVLVSFSEPDVPIAEGGVRIQGYGVPDLVGGIKQIIVTNPGRGYTSPPTVTVAAPKGTGSDAVANIATGLGYSTDPGFKIGVSFGKPDSQTGVQMRGYAVPDGDGGVAEVVITQQGRGYATPPTINIDPPINVTRAVLGLRAAGVVRFQPSYPPDLDVTLRNLIGGDDSALSMTANFTNYDALRAGQPVFGEGVRPGTVITRVLPAVRRVEVTPGGLPVRLTVNDVGMQFVPSRSEYYTDGFDHYLQMPPTFNEFHSLNVGQRVRWQLPAEAESAEPSWAETVITAIDPVYRQIGLRPLDLPPLAVSEVIFDSLSRVEFGMIERTGTGRASFSVTPFGYEAMTVNTQAVASGVASIRVADEAQGIYEVELQNISDETAVVAGRIISGVGFRSGYRIERYDGKIIKLFSADIVAKQGSPGWFSLDPNFRLYSTLRVGMRVSGDGVPANTTIGSVDQAAGSVYLITADGETTTTPADYAGGKVVFGNPFTEKWLSQGIGEQNVARSGITIHREAANVGTVIAAKNVRDEVAYFVSTEGGSSDDAGSLARIISLAQQNQYHFDEGNPLFGQDENWGGQGIRPVVEFSEGVTSIELQEPLPSIKSNAIEIDGGYFDNGERRRVEVNGRFIDQTIAGDAVLSTTAINGIVIEGSQASGTAIRNLRLGGFNNGSSVRIDGANDVLVAESIIGRTATGIRAGSKFGVLITGGAKNTTVVNTEILSAEQAGVRVAAESTGANLVGLTVGRDYGSPFSPNVFWNETGLEVVADSVQLGVEAIGWRIMDENQPGVPKTYSAGLVSGSEFITLDMTSSRWAQLETGLAVIGLGLSPSTVIQSVDVANKRVKLSKPATRTTNARVMIGHQAVGFAGGNEAVLGTSVDPSRLYVGQEVRFVTGTLSTRVFETTIASIEGDGSDAMPVKVGLADRLELAGLYEQGIRLIEFGEPSANTIQYSRNGVVVGLFGTVSAPASGAEPPKLIVTQDFTGWDSLREEMSFKVRTSSDEASSPQFLEGSVVGWDQAAREIEFEPLPGQGAWAGFQNRPVTFKAADQFEMVSTTITDSIQNGLVFGGGNAHRIGGKTDDLDVLATLSDAQDAGEEKGSEFGAVELVSYGTAANIEVTGRMRISNDATAAWLGEQVNAQGVPNRVLNLYGTGLPEGSRVKQYDVATRYLLIEVHNYQDGAVVEQPGFVQVTDGTVYFGLGAFCAIDPKAVRVGDHVDGQEISEFLSVEAFRMPVMPTAQLAVPYRGYLAISTPNVGLTEGRLPKAGDMINLTNRSGPANVLRDNSEYGISLIDTLPGFGGGLAGSLYDGLFDSWKIAGNYIDLSYDIPSARWLRSPNFAGPIHPTLFAELFGENDTYSGFDRTDAFGNQYGEEQVVPSTGGGGGATDDDPFGETSPVDGGDGETPSDGALDGTGAEPNTGYRPGVPF